MATLTASALSVVSSTPGIHIKDNFAAVIAAGLDDVFKRESAIPAEGMHFFRNKPMKKATNVFQSHYGLGTVGQNEDTETLPVDEKGLGFQWTLSVNTYRGAIRIAKDLQEDELYGNISDLQSEHVGAEKTSKELVLADLFNRALGTSGAPILCEDGMYFLDSARPFAYTAAGTWSNLETASAITPASVFQAQLNFKASLNDRGYLSPRKLTKAIVRDQDEDTMFEITKSDLRPTDAMNAKNFQYGRFEYSTYSYLTSALIIYMSGDPKSAANELYFGDRISPELATWKDGSNPDITWQRIRSRFGIGCGKPIFWRGGTVS